jgi:hypothetical protein
MKRIAVIVAFLLVAGCGKEQSLRAEASSSEESPGVSLRRMTLTSPPEELGFTADADFPTVYGVLTDWDIGGVTATVMSMRDGTASLYTTSTFGVIGSGAYESVRRAATRYVKVAERFAESGKPITEFDYPKSGQVFYYILTYDGVRLVVADERAIRSGSDPTRRLFAAAQDVLTELRLIDEKEDAQPEN